MKNYIFLETFQNNESSKEEIKSLFKNIEWILTNIVQWWNDMTIEQFHSIYEVFKEIKNHLNTEWGMNLSLILNRLNILHNFVIDIKAKNCGISRQYTREFPRDDRYEDCGSWLPKSDRFERFNKNTNRKVSKNSIYGLAKYIGEILKKAWVDISTLNIKHKIYSSRKYTRFWYEDVIKYRVEKIIYSL